MKRTHCPILNSRNKKIACAISAASLMLGVSSAATVGLHFQDNYCGSASYSGFLVTMPAFGIQSNGWENLTEMDCGYGCVPDLLVYSLNETISTLPSGGGLNPLPNGTINVNWTAATANFSGFAGYAGSPPSYDYGGHYPGSGITASGEEEIYSSFLRDGYNFGPGSGGDGVNNEPVYMVDITGLSTLFTNTPFVVELVAAADSMQMLTNAFVIDVDDLITDSVTYPSTPPVTEDRGGENWVRGHDGGLSTVSGVFSTDHIQLKSNHPMGGGNKTVGYDNAGTICGFILTDKPVISMYPQTIPLNGPGDSVTLSAYAIGVPPLSYQWQRNGASIPGATNLSYSLTNVTLAGAGAYTLLVTNLYGAATSKVSTVTVDSIVNTAASGIIYDSNPDNPQHDGFDVGTNGGASWEAFSSDGSITRDGVMDFVATNDDGIMVSDSSAFDGPAGTITFWMRSAGTDLNSIGVAGASIITRTPETSALKDFLLLQADGSMGALDFQAPGGANSFTSQAGVSDNKWHFIALTFDQATNGGVALYIDGILDTTNANAANWTWPAGEPLEIGYNSDGTWRDYNGLLNDVRYYSAQLTPSQLATIKSSGALADAADLQLEFEFAAAPGAGITLTWQETTAVLQSASSLNGPWADVTGAASPYTVVPSNAQQYFRYRYVPRAFVSNPYLM